MSIKNAIEVSGLSKTYKDFKLKDINFNLEKGTIMGLVGANGSGKTTTIKSILDIIKYDGEIKVFGKKLNENTKEDIAVVLDDAFISILLTPKEVERVMSGIYKNWDKNYYYELLEKFDLPKNKRFEKLSKGMKMKLKIVAALATRPKLLILDEPTSGLDPMIRDDILDVFLEFVEDEENTILFSSHITTDIEKVADYITFIDNGQIIFSKEKYGIYEDYGLINIKKDELNNIDRNFIEKYKDEKYSTKVLIKNKEDFKNRYDYELEKFGIEEIMLMHTKGLDLWLE